MKKLWVLAIMLFLFYHLEASKMDKLMDGVQTANLKKVKKYAKIVRKQINKQNDFGETPLSSAATGDSCSDKSICAEIITVLMVRGNADPTVPDINGDPPLIIAARQGGTAMVAALLDNRAKIEIKDINGNTPLGIATSNRRLGTVMYLLHRGANPKAKNNDGETIMDIAKWVYDKNKDDKKKKRWGTHQLEIIKDAAKNFKNRKANGLFRSIASRGRMSREERRKEKQRIEAFAKLDEQTTSVLKAVDLNHMD